MLNIKPHPNDVWCDQLILAPLGDRCPYKFEICLQERYKTSELSGNEWRFSHVCSAFRFQPRGEDRLLHQESYGAMETAFAFFPRLLSAESVETDSIRPDVKFLAKFYNRGVQIHEQKFNHLMHALMHLPGSWYEIMETTEANDRVVELRQNCCTQPGCPNKPVSTYQLKQEYDRGHLLAEEDRPGKRIRQFCQNHLRRGDASLEDCDENYLVLLGPGPNQGVIDPSLVGRAQRIYL